MNTIGRYAVAIVACYVSLAIGYIFFGVGAADWYTRLTSYAYAAPLTVLVPILLIVYGITGVAIGRFWSAVTVVHSWISYAFLSLFFLGGWMMFLIGYHAVFIALILCAILFIVVVPLFMAAWEKDRIASYLFIPYLIWCSYALYFTTAVWLGMGR